MANPISLREFSHDELVDYISKNRHNIEKNDLCKIITRINKQRMHQIIRIDPGSNLFVGLFNWDYTFDYNYSQWQGWLWENYGSNTEVYFHFAENYHLFKYLFLREGQKPYEYFVNDIHNGFVDIIHMVRGLVNEKYDKDLSPAYEFYDAIKAAGGRQIYETNTIQFPDRRIDIRCFHNGKIRIEGLTTKEYLILKKCIEKITYDEKNQNTVQKRTQSRVSK